MSSRQQSGDKSALSKERSKKTQRHVSIGWDTQRLLSVESDSVNLTEESTSGGDSFDFDDNQDSFVCNQSHHGSISEVTEDSSETDLFNSKNVKPTASKKHSSIKQCIRAAILKKSDDHHITLPKDGSAHPSPTNHSKYYHTFTAASTSRRNSTVMKVMDIFRNKQSVPSDQLQEQNQSKTLMKAGVRSRIRRAADIFHSGSSSRRNSATKTEIVCSSTLFRNTRGLSINDPFLELMKYSPTKESDNSVIVNFFKYHKCVELIPTSAKVVIFDSQLLVRRAFSALVSNGMHAAPIWDTSRQQFVGVLTITDFIKILQKHHHTQNILTDLEDHTLQNWKDLLKGSHMPLISIEPDMSLYEAIIMLTKNHIHRLPIIDPIQGDLLYILTLKCILKFLFIYIGKLPQPSYMNQPLSISKIGTMENIKLATEETSVIEALEMFISHRVSALPIVDSSDRLKDVYSKCDVINLAIDKTYDNLNATLKQVTANRDIWYEGFQKCTLDDSFYDLLEKIVFSQVHRLVVVDKQEKVIGMISLSDLMKHIILQS